MADDCNLGTIGNYSATTRTKQIVEKVYEDFQKNADFSNLDDFGFDTGSDDLSWF